MLKFFRRIAFHPEMILRPLFCLKDTKNTGSLTFNSLKPNKFIFNFFLLTVTEKNYTIAVKEPKFKPITVKATTPLRPSFLVHPGRSPGI